MPTFTDKGIKSLDPKPTAYRVYERASDPGFCVRITPSGTKTFQMAYTVNGRKRFMRLGTYPATTLADARQAAREARSLVDRGIDPQEERERQRQEAEAARREASARGSVRELVEHYIATLVRTGRDWREVRRALENDAIPVLGESKKARDVTARDIAQTLHRVHQRGAASMANHLRRYLHRMFQLGIHHDHDPKNLSIETQFGIESNPVSAVPHDATAEKAGTRELSWAELRTIWWALDAYCSPAQASALRILICSGLRVREVIHAERSEVDLDSRLWRIPGHRIKTRTKRPDDHLVPITPLIAEQLEAAMIIAGRTSTYLFPAHNNPRATRPMHDTSLSHACQDLSKGTGLPHFTPRDLRRTWKTRGAEIGIPMELRNLVQNHARSDVASIHYDAWSYIDEKREALTRFCDHLGEVLVSQNQKVG